MPCFSTCFPTGLWSDFRHVAGLVSLLKDSGGLVHLYVYLAKCMIKQDMLVKHSLWSNHEKNKQKLQIIWIFLSQRGIILLKKFLDHITQNRTWPRYLTKFYFHMCTLCKENEQKLLVGRLTAANQIYALPSSKVPASIFSWSLHLYIYTYHSTVTLWHL